MNYHINAVTRIDPRTNRVVGQPVKLSFAPAGVAAGAGKLWIVPSRYLANRPQDVASIAELDVGGLGDPTMVALEGVPEDAEWFDGALWVTLPAPRMIVKLSP